MSETMGPTCETCLYGAQHGGRLECRVEVPGAMGDMDPDWWCARGAWRLADLGLAEPDGPAWCGYADACMWVAARQETGHG